MRGRHQLPLFARRVSELLPLGVDDPHRKIAVAQPRITLVDPAIREETIVSKVAKCGKNR